MKYSFVLIAFNEQHNIAHCIKSISSQKGIGTDYEILVVDDGSTDETSQIVQTLSKKNKRLRLVSDGKNHGRGFGRYRGVQESKGSYVAMVDADIILPQTWLKDCLAHTQLYDVVGGIAVPDGDVAYIYRVCKLTPKPVIGTTTITGNNGLYKSEVFKKLNFNPKLRDGEDVDFNNRAVRVGVTELCIPSIHVEHQEHKSFIGSMRWLYQSGIGATRLFLLYKTIRLPDLAFVITVGVTLGAAVLVVLTGAITWLLPPLLIIMATSTIHIRGKFALSFTHPIQALGAISLNAVLITCYYGGRIVGPFKLLGSKSRV